LHVIVHVAPVASAVELQVPNAPLAGATFAAHELPVHAVAGAAQVPLLGAVPAEQVAVPNAVAPTV